MWLRLGFVVNLAFLHLFLFVGSMFGFVSILTFDGVDPSFLSIYTLGAMPQRGNHATQPDLGNPHYP